MNKILITGAAGFIGFHLCKRLLEMDYEVVGIDNLNSYYDVTLKLDRLRNLGVVTDFTSNLKLKSTTHKKFSFIKLGLENREELFELFEQEKFDQVVNLAAQAGVRYSIDNPFAYVESNIIGFINILEACRKFNVDKLLYASSSSVYGKNEKVPFSTKDNVDYPISLYAATKKSNELMAHTYSHLYGIKTIGLRFFTVYGPWGRPDMAMFLFTDAIFQNRPIKVFNKGNLSRDFTYIDDIIDGVFSIINDEKKKNEPLYKVYNIGNSKPIKLLDFIEELEKVTNRKSDKIFMDMQPGDVEKTWADTSDLQKDYDYKAQINIDIGVRRFVEWYIDYYSIKFNSKDQNNVSN